MFHLKNKKKKKVHNFFFKLKFFTLFSISISLFRMRGAIFCFSYFLNLHNSNLFSDIMMDDKYFQNFFYCLGQISKTSTVSGFNHLYRMMGHSSSQESSLR